MISYTVFQYISPRHLNTGLLSSGPSLTACGEGASLALVGDPFSDWVTIKMLRLVQW